jgi:SAM-dependent methyltransferase
VSRGDWQDYVGHFHDAKPGITERVLGRCRAGGDTPYQWLGANVDGTGTTVDLACGSAPMLPVIGRGWLGVDRSGAELTAARRTDPTAPLCRADAGALPFRDGHADTVLCSMGLMVLPSVDAALREVVRVARPGARIAVLVPAGKPMAVRDRVRYARLLLALRLRRFQYPNPDVVRDPAGLLDRAGLAVVDDSSRRFELALTDDTTADLLVESLYLPRTAPNRVEAARRLVRRWVGASVGIPLRRVVAEPA